MSEEGPAARVGGHKGPPCCAPINAAELPPSLTVSPFPGASVSKSCPPTKKPLRAEKLLFCLPPAQKHGGFIFPGADPGAAPFLPLHQAGCDLLLSNPPERLRSAEQHREPAPGDSSDPRLE